MIDLQHPPFPPAGACLVTMHISGCFLIFISAPPACSSSKSPVLAEQLREHKEISSQIKPSLRLECFPERTARALLHLRRRVPNERVGMRLCLKKKPTLHSRAPAVRPDTQRAEEFS